ncbi:DUF924 domain-containing protein [Stappia sp. F7233]|uniref:DUF924 domain-containing protein n=1 Tax=Stappia albiluteola TaxID=2758565 RepID=A0A839AHT1_9HYPH|nr:DUF924 family protein [Stappia albiluteola]MBA5778636.1 DUF924 domain-containing protein [Stappia albiluteola]
MTEPVPSPFDILDFWWQAGPSKWFARSDAFDCEICGRFGATVDAAIGGDFEDWRHTPHGALALLLLLDQFTRNIHRGQARAFAGDRRALDIARSAVEQEFDRAFPKEARTFFYLPFEHAEDMAAQERSVDLFRRNSVEKEYLYALIHLDVIRRFGRFPHRNAVLGRETTEAEAAYLADGGFSA